MRAERVSSMSAPGEDVAMERELGPGVAREVAEAARALRLQM